MLSSCQSMYILWCTVEHVLRDHPSGHTNVVSQDRRFLVTGSITLKCRTFCQKYLVSQDRFHYMYYLCEDLPISLPYEMPCAFHASYFAANALESSATQIWHIELFTMLPEHVAPNFHTMNTVMSVILDISSHSTIQW